MAEAAPRALRAVLGRGFGWRGTAGPGCSEAPRERRAPGRRRQRVCIVRPRGAAARARVGYPMGGRRSPPSPPALHMAAAGGRVT